ncbi:TraB/GumN family protein [Natronospirillum operosum]|uniref:TraB/GumN family protein n=1 Tax=Natronospirillum operosum TaxID=2759953 RepID=A0A4Z0WFF8_9GAMM|nr:TraB/GumN family protein [Natronospirillum operosum]TGG95760.1 TraB/GumN family protein [Natronospirillum operosum]
MTTDTASTAASTAPGGGPRHHVHRDQTDYTLLGTAHVSRASAEEVRALIRSGEFDAVAIELCPSRYQSMVDPDALARLDLFQVIRQGKAGLVAANLALGAFQQRVAEESGIEPGAEMKVAIEEARTADLPLWLIDRDVGTTLRRVYRNVPWWQRSGLIMGLLGSVISREKITAEDIEQLKEGDVLTSTFREFAEESEAIYTPLITERDEFMALRLLQENARGEKQRVLAVVGAGHLEGMQQFLRDSPAGPHPAQRISQLNEQPRSSRWPKAIPWVIAALIITGFVIGFSRSSDLGWQLITDWFLINGTLTAIGTAIARGHPITILAGFLAAPFTSLNPTIGAGFVAAAVEIMVRKPRVHDFSHLREDVVHFTGWWKNRVSRTLLVFIFASLGSMAGTYAGGFRIAGLLTGG